MMYAPMPGGPVPQASHPRPAAAQRPLRGDAAPALTLHGSAPRRPRHSPASPAPSRGSRGGIPRWRYAGARGRACCECEPGKHAGWSAPCVCILLIYSCIMLDGQRPVYGFYCFVLCNTRLVGVHTCTWYVKADIEVRILGRTRACE